MPRSGGEIRVPSSPQPLNRRLPCTSELGLESVNDFARMCPCPIEDSLKELTLILLNDYLGFLLICSVLVSFYLR